MSQDEGPAVRPPDPRMIPPWQAPAPPRDGGPADRPLPGADPYRGLPRHADPPGGPYLPGGSFLPGGSGLAGPAARGSDGSLPASGADDLVIRPFLLTGGRTRPAQEGLPVEALVQSRLAAPGGSLRFEARQIVELCQQPLSVAELAAALRVPLGVVRVLVCDLAADGVVTLAQREEPSVQLLERIRDRVRAI